MAALALAAEVDVSLFDRGPPNPTELLCCDLVTGSIVDQCLSGFSAHNNFLPIINGGTLHASMSEEIADSLYRGLFAQQMHRQGMAKAMRTPEVRKTNSGACHPGIERITDRS